MKSEIQILAILGSLAVLLLVIHLIRRRMLREEYALLWFGGGMVLLVLSLWRGLLHTVAGLVGVAYPPSVLLLGVIATGFLVSMHYSVSLSRLDQQNKRLAQELALLRLQVEKAAETPAPAAGE
ncbi:MAG: DUF2304 domain-containing protein [Acidobacteria bacterium]|nr:DUF2304 domain-containing protein [Acidobacteriota bacterium]MBK8316005.1 DUF2304 domain-containing protein [Acidobacteriota bacterium]